MSKYPEVITPEVLAKVAHVSVMEILRDIDDTEREIHTETARADAQRIVATNTPRDSYNWRMEQFRADAYRDGVQQRKEFVAFLRRVLEARQAAPA